MRLNSYIRLDEAKNDSKRTRLQECLHCVIFGIGQKKKKLTEEIWTMPDLLQNSYDRYCSMDTTFDELYTWIQDEPKWRTSIIKVSNILASSGWLKGGNYKFHRNDAFMNSIYSMFQKIAQTEGVKLNNDKWNPSDIWASKGSVAIPNSNNLEEYNKFIFDSMNKGNLVGISLKMVAGSPKLVIQTPSDAPEPMKYKSIKKPTTMFPTGITIELKKAGHGINYRSFRVSKQAFITGELVIKGTGARHGKVASNVTKKIIKDYNIPQMSKSRIDSMSDEELQLAAIELWADCGHVFSTENMEKRWEKRSGDIQDRTGYWMSLINSLELGAYVNRSSAANNIVNVMWKSGKSASASSSAFIKIY